MPITYRHLENGIEYVNSQIQFLQKSVAEEEKSFLGDIATARSITETKKKLESDYSLDDFVRN